MAAPKGSAPSKGYYEAVKAIVAQLVSDGVVATDTTVANVLVALDAEIVAR
jgi:hypothetical protein